MGCLRVYRNWGPASPGSGFNYLVDGVPALAFGFPGVVPDLFGL